MLRPLWPLALLLPLLFSAVPAAACTAPPPVPGECHSVCIDAGSASRSCAPGFIGLTPITWAVIGLVVALLGAGVLALVATRRRLSK